MTDKSLTPRQIEIASLVARGLPDKVIAARTGLTVMTVRTYIHDAAALIPGEASPRFRLALWFLNIETDEKAG